MKSLKVDFEILVCDNGSTDFKEIKFTHKEIRYLRDENKGIGVGIKLGIENAQYENLMFYAIDLPFGTKIIEESLTESEKYDIVIGSKGHVDSVNNHTFKRKIFSFAYNTLINLFFHLDVKDSQGSMLFKRKNIVQIIHYLDSSDAFFQTQLLIYSKLIDNSIVEIPVEYESQRSGSKISPIKDGLHMLKQLLKERKKVKEIEKQTD